jgi:cholesterol oxidase
MTLNRRAFGTRLLSAAAALGLRTVGGTGLISAAACASPQARTPRGQDPDLDPDLEFAEVPLTHVQADTVVVGTGYGGAVVAKRLSEKGVSVLMLEMGRLWNQPGPDGKVFCGINGPDGRAMWFQDKLVLGGLMPLDIDIPIAREAGIVDVVQTESMSAYCGRGVGGGSLVNMAMLVVPPREVLADRFPGVDIDQLLAVHYPRALAMLKGNQVRRAWWEKTPWYQYSRVGYAASEAAGFASEFLTSGYDYGYMEKEETGAEPASALAGEAGFGNNYGKQSVDKNYLADALGTGKVTIESLHIVREVRRDGDQYVLGVNVIDVLGALVERKEITCKSLFFCGGSMGTSRLLTRAREIGSLPDLNEQVGTGWGPNSDIFVYRANPIWNPTGDKIATVPATGWRTVDQDGKQVFSMDIPYPVGIETWASFNILMTENPEEGSFRYDPLSDQAVLKWEAGQNEPALKSARYVMDKLNAANLTTYKPEMFRGQDMLGDTTYHPVGGCPLGRATDDYGRLHGYKNLYVQDGSLIPAGIVANPALTVAALAERNIERILAEDYGL